MAKRDYYEVLGIGRDADEAEIRKAYRRLARKHHPDANPDDDQAAERFKEVREAYDVLSDAEKRAAYDRFGHAAQEAGGFGGAEGFGPFDGMGTIFEEMFRGFGVDPGGGGGGARPTRGGDLEQTVNLTFREAAFGVEKEITVNRAEPCTTCSGSGAAPGTQPSRCSECGGSGQVRVTRNTLMGTMVTVTTCGRCGGTGEVITTPCAECMGRRRVRRQRTIQVSIPAGVDTGVRIRVAGQGHVGDRGGPPGDLFLRLRVQPHKTLQRDGQNVISVHRVGMAQAALGTTIEVETLDGPQKVDLAPGTQPGAEIRLRGRGIPSLRGALRGDHLVRVQVTVPKDLKDEEKELLVKLAQLRGEEVGSGDRSFLRRVRDAFQR